MFKYIFFIITLSTVLLGCIKNNPDPSWISVNTWTLQNNPDLGGVEGPLNHNITEAWVYIDDELIGVFQVPFKIPVLKKGTSTLKIYPAIKNNGISATKKIYPFLEPYVITANLVQNETLVINPITSYVTNISIWKEDFEDVNVKITDDPNTSAAHMQFVNEDLNWFNGNYYAKIDLNETDSMWVAYTDALSLPKGKECYLEIDYLVTNNVTQGVLFSSPSGITPNPYMRLNRQEEGTTTWKKMYIDLKELVGAAPANTQYLQSFTAFLDDDKTATSIKIDNLKIIHF
ncbi:MAG: hypothetical protein RL264_1955 [Bacteroidota bacterium]|jgi:hypothetical protein